MIDFKNVTKKYKSIKAIDNLSMTINKNEITVLIGPSGCGKTTLLKMINRLIDLTSGDILLGEESIVDMNPIKLRRKIGYVIQEIGLFPHMTIKENIQVVPKLLKYSKKEMDERANELMETINMDPSKFLNQYPAQLSGGQRQRIGVARALAANPDILLMDEPFGAIDPINRAVLQDSFLEIQEKIKKTIVFVTHDIHEAIKMGDQICILNKGKIAQYDTVEQVIQNPAGTFVEKLLGADRALKGLELYRVRSEIESDFPTLPKSEIPESNWQALLDNEKYQKGFLLVDDRGRLLGFCQKSDMEKLKLGESLDDVLREEVSVRPHGTLMEAVGTIFSTGSSLLPVTDDHGYVKGVIRLSAILSKVDRGEDS